MKNIIESLLESGEETSYVGYDDADALGDAYVNLSRYMESQIKTFQQSCRELVASFPDIKSACVHIDCCFPKFAYNPLCAKVELEKICRHACVSEEDPSVVKAGIETALATSITSNEGCKTFSDAMTYLKETRMSEDTNYGVDVSAESLTDIKQKYTERILGFVDILINISNVIKQTAEHASNVELINKYAEYFNVFCKFANMLAYVTAYHYNAWWTTQNLQCNSPIKAAAVKSEEDLKKYETELDKTQDCQVKWQDKFGKSNSELENKINILNEKIAACKSEFMINNEAAEKETEENVSKYNESLKKCVEEIREFYTNYENKELLDSRMKHIDKMEEYMKGALERKYPLRIPLYQMNNASKESKDLIKDTFIPKISDIADKYPEFIIFAPNFDDESDDLFIYLTLREPHGDKEDKEKRENDDDPKGKETQNEAVDNTKWDRHMYRYDRKGRFIEVTAPDGRSLGGFDTYEDAKPDVAEDMEAHNAKVKDTTMNETVLYKEDRDKLKASDFGVPDIKGYPLTDEEHIRKAIQFFGYCKAEYKETLAKNIVKKIIAFDLVGKVTVSEKNPGKKYFPEWVLSNVKATCIKTKTTYKIMVEGKEVAHGSLPKQTKESSVNESIFIDPVTGQFYL